MSAVYFSDYHSVDYDACLSLFDANCPTAFHPGERQDFDAFLLDLPGPYLLMQHQEFGLIGCGGYAFNQQQKSAELCWGMVHPKHQKQGYGKALLEERLARIKLNTEIKAVALCTTPDTVAFFTPFNFSVQQTTNNGFGEGVHQVDMIMRYHHNSN